MNRNGVSTDFPRASTGLLLTLLCLVLSSCIGERTAGATGVGNPPQHAQVELAFKATSSSSVPAKAAALEKAADGGRTDIGSSPTIFSLSDGGGMPLVLTAASAHIGEIRIRLPDGVSCSDQLEAVCEASDVKLTGPIFSDLMAGGHPGELGEIRLPVGNYRSLEVKLEPYRPNAGPVVKEPKLEGYSMLLQGTFTYQGLSGRSFFILLRFDEEVRFEASEHIEVFPDTLNRLQVALDVEQWFTQVDIGDCLDKGNLELDSLGNLRVDDNNACSELEGDLKASIKASGRLEKAANL